MPRPKGRPMGRPTYLTEQCLEDLIRLAKLPISKRALAEKYSIHYTTFRDWERRGEADEVEGKDTIFSRLSTGIRASRAEYTASAVASIMKAGQMPQHWQATAWLLERTNPADFGKQDRVPVGLMNRLDAVIAQTGLTEEEILAEVADGEANED